MSDELSDAEFEAMKAESRAAWDKLSREEKAKEAGVDDPSQLSEAEWARLDETVGSTYSDSEQTYADDPGQTRERGSAEDDSDSGGEQLASQTRTLEKGNMAGAHMVEKGNDAPCAICGEPRGYETPCPHCGME